MILSAHQPQYLPWLGYFNKILNSDCFVFLDEVQYKEREFQNRNKIRTNSGWIWLTVPVVSKGYGRQKIKDVLIDNEIDWRKKHLGSLKAFYCRAPFFGKYIGFFEELYAKEWDKLFDLNLYIIDFILKEFGIKTELKMESEIGTESKKTDRIIELCKKLKADEYLSGSGGADYLEGEKFRTAGIKLSYQNFKHPVYRQCFKDKEFIPFLSAVDLLFNEGPESIKVVKEGYVYV